MSPGQDPALRDGWRVPTADEARCAACRVEHATGGRLSAEGGHTCRLALAGARDGAEGPLPAGVAHWRRCAACQAHRHRSCARIVGARRCVCFCNDGRALPLILGGLAVLVACLLGGCVAVTVPPPPPVPPVPPGSARPSWCVDPSRPILGKDGQPLYTDPGWECPKESSR